jgi:hypothetical protein
MYIHVNLEKSFHANKKKSQFFKIEILIIENKLFMKNIFAPEIFRITGGAPD